MTKNKEINTNSKNQQGISDEDLKMVAGGVDYNTYIDVEAKVKASIIEVCDINNIEIWLDIELVNELGMDFLDKIDLIQHLNEILGISINETTFLTLVTIGDVMNYVVDLLDLKS